MSDAEMIAEVAAKITPIIRGAVTRAKDEGYAEAKAEAKEALNAMRVAIMHEMNKEQADYDRYAAIAAILNSTYKEVR